MIVEANIPLAYLHTEFLVKDVYTHQHYVHLPQTNRSIPRSGRQKTGAVKSFRDNSVASILQLAGGGSLSTPNRHGQRTH